MLSLIPYRVTFFINSTQSGYLAKPDQHSGFHRKCFGNRWYIFYGPVTPKSSFLLQNTGKSPAIQHAAQDPLDFIQLLDTVITKTTSSGLVKHLAQHKKGIILSPEVFDILNKLMKSDEDNATGDVQLLCKLFSGEHCSHHYSIQHSIQYPWLNSITKCC